MEQAVLGCGARASPRHPAVQRLPHKNYVPEKYCPVCLSPSLGWIAASGKGEVYSHSVQIRSAPSSFEAQLPYVVAIIRLDEGVQMMSNVIGDDASKVQCGDRVSVAFASVPDTDVVLPVFRLERSRQ